MACDHMRNAGQNWRINSINMITDVKNIWLARCFQGFDITSQKSRETKKLVKISKPFPKTGMLAAEPSHGLARPYYFPLPPASLQTAPQHFHVTIHALPPVVGMVGNENYLDAR